MLVVLEQSADDAYEPVWVFGGVEGVGGEDEVEFLFPFLVLVVFIVSTIITVVIIEGIGIKIRPVERSGCDGAGRGEVCVCTDVVGEVWKDGGEICEVGCGLEEGGSGNADEAGAGAEFEDMGTCGRGVDAWGCRIGIGVRIVWLGRSCFDAGEMTREESGEAFGEQVGSDPCFMTEIIARQRWFM